MMKMNSARRDSQFKTCNNLYVEILKQLDAMHIACFVLGRAGTNYLSLTSSLLCRWDLTLQNFFLLTVSLLILATLITCCICGITNLSFLICYFKDVSTNYLGEFFKFYGLKHHMTLMN